jgi:DNA-binding LytR/AlgR family response regulator
MRGTSANRQVSDLTALIIVANSRVRDEMSRNLTDRSAVAIVGVCDQFSDAVASAIRQRPDVVLFDVQAERKTVLAFIAALPLDYAPTISFMDGAISLLPRIRQLTVAGDSVSAQQNAIALAEQRPVDDVFADPPKTLLVRQGRRTSRVQIASIEWIKAESCYARLHANGASYLTRVSLRVLETILPPRQFVRVHRSTIVNVGRVSATRSDGSVRVVEVASIQLRASRPGFATLLRALRAQALSITPRAGRDQHRSLMSDAMI